jgi:CHAT domain-containing protein
MLPRKYARCGLALLAITFGLSGPVSNCRRLFLSVFAEADTSDRAGTNITTLKAPNSIARELSSGDVHHYQIKLESDQYLHIEVEPEGVNARIVVYGPNEQLLLELDCRNDGPTPVSLITAVAGIYRLELRLRESEQTRGRYGLKVEELRSVRSNDRYRIAAEKAIAEADQLLKEWRADSSRTAIDKLRASLSSWRSAGAHDQEAQTLKRIGAAYQPLGQYQNALSFYNQALSLSRKIKDRSRESETLNEIGCVYITLGDTRKALELCTRALQISRSIINRRNEARALNSLGEIHYGLGNLQHSLELYQQALAIWHEVGDREGKALSLLNCGYTCSDLGQIKEALAFFNQALSFWQAARHRRGEALTLTAIGRLYSRTGETQKALDFFQESMELIHVIGDPIEEARILNGMAYVYDGMGEKRRALEYYDRALSLFRDADYLNGEASTLGDAGGVWYSLGDTEKALSYHQNALSIFRAVGDHRLEIFELKEIGKVYEAKGEKAKALKNYLSARSFYRSEKDLRGEADAVNLIGRIHQDMGQTKRALQYYDHALLLNRQAEYRFGEATTLYNMARLERDRGNLIPAKARTEAGLEVIESLRTKVVSQDLRASYFASVRQHHELFIDILMQLHKERPTEGFDSAAFDASERARARSLLESLSEARADIRQGVNPALLGQERSLQEALNAKAERHMQLIAARDKEQAEILAKEIDQLTTEYGEIEAQIRSTSPRYAALTQPQPLLLKEIQRQVLDDNSLLLEYALGDERSYLWAVTRTEVWSYELPGRANIEEAARRVRALLTANQPTPGETFEQRQIRVADADAQLPAETAALSKLVLAPVITRLGNKRLLIIADGALQYIPFQTLTVQRNHNDVTSQSEVSTRPDDQVPLVFDHEIVNEPSASTLALVLSDMATRKPPPDTIAVLADPVFEADDPRVRVSSPTGTQGAPYLSRKNEVQQAFRDVGLPVTGVQVPRLISSRVEADAIMNVTPWGTGLKALDFDASRATVTGANLGRYRIVHFATHGFIDDQHPELSGIVLSLVDEQGRPQDGFLRMHDIYNLKLSADLVVLSACNTGLGKEVKGEGLIGLTRGFMYAGASGVLASLWKVDDEATAELMKQFYEAMLKKGMSPAAALRDSQLAMRRQKRWQAPYYWAGFVIQGQYNEKVVMSGPSFRAGALLSALAAMTFALLLAAFFALRRRRRRII